MKLPYGTAYLEFLKVQKTETDECVPWPHQTNGVGYGKVWDGKRMAYTHRISCEMAHGPAPDGYHAAHLCRTTLCMNPRHLRWASASDNQMDRVKDGTSNRGERCGGAKLSETDVRTIRWLLSAGEHCRDIAKVFRVSETTIADILKKRTWAWFV